MKTYTTLLLVLAASNISSAQDQNTEHTLHLGPGVTPAAARIEDFAWLQGYWVGDGLGGKCEEMWSAPMSGAMLGTFRLMNDDELQFSEFFVLSEVDGHFSLRLKHFDAALKGWEEKDKFVEFKLVKTEGTTAWLEGLTYQLDDQGMLRVYVAMKQKDGSTVEGEFTFRQTKPAHRD